MAQYKRYGDLNDSSSKPAEPKSNTTGEYDVLHVQGRDHKNKIIKANPITVVYVWGAFCQPCKTSSPAFVQFSQDYERNQNKKCTFLKEDVTMSISGCTAVPMLLIYTNHSLDPVSKIEGADFGKLRTILDDIKQKMFGQK